MVQGADLVIIATPLSSYKDVVIKIKNSLKNGAILTDVGSVKKKVIYLHQFFLILIKKYRLKVS